MLRDPSKKAGEKEHSRGHQPSNHGQEDWRAPPEQHVSPPKQHPEHSQDGEAKEAWNQRAAYDSAHGAKKVTRTIVSRVEQIIPPNSAEKGVILAAVREDGQRDQEGQGQQNQAKDFLLALPRYERAG